jgi:hypothetical protein
MSGAIPTSTLPVCLYMTFTGATLPFTLHMTFISDVQSLCKFLKVIKVGLIQFVCLFLARQPPVGQGVLIHEVSRSHTATHHSR